MTDFKFGDKVKVEFEAYIDKFSDCGVYLRGDNYQNLHVLNKHITLIERAKTKLEVGQKWSRPKSRVRKILALHIDEVAFIEFGRSGIGVERVDVFRSKVNELITEGENG